MNLDPFDLVGDVLDGQFRVDAFAGEGDLSVVYKGHHLGVDAPVVIKCLNVPETLDPALVRPLVDGFKEASRVHYRLARGNLHIAQTIASGSTLLPRSGVVVPYLVREWYDGESLRSDLARRRAGQQAGRALDETLALLESAFDAVAYAHTQGEAHLQLSPSNLFVVVSTASTPRALKVLDFGVASAMSRFAAGIPTSARPAAGLRLLFPAYAAPEQLDRTVGPVGPWTDVYALAIVMMEMLSDRIVMGESDSGAIVDHALDELRRPTPQSHGLTLPSHVERALGRAVARSPQRRQKNAGELWKDLRNTVRTLAPRAASFGPPLAVSTTPPRLAQTPKPSSANGPSGLSGLLAPPSLARLRAPTLVGLNPVITAVPGAVTGGRDPAQFAPTVTTRPMAFEPGAGRAEVAGAGGGAGAVVADVKAAVESLPLPASVTELWTPADPELAAPPPAAPSASGAIEAWAPSERSTPPLALSLPRMLPWLLGSAGALFWSGIVVIFAVVFLVPGWRRTHEANRPIAATRPGTTAVAFATPSSAMMAANPPATATGATAATAFAGSGLFRSGAAIHALDGKWRDVAKCRRGKGWGKASTTVTFAADGSVVHIDVGPPFAGTPTGDCIAAALGTVHIPPFDAKTAAISYRVYVAPK